MLNAPEGKRLAPMLDELVPVLRRFGELAIDEDTAASSSQDHGASMLSRIGSNLQL